MHNLYAKFKLTIAFLLTVLFITSTNNISLVFAKSAAETLLSTSSSDILSTYNKVAYVKDFGAYGDGIHDDTKAINNALNSGADAVVFENNAFYKTNSYITMNTDGVTVIGQNATLFTDNDYRSRANYYEWYFNVVADNITIDGLNILAKETILVGYKTQFAVRYASNVIIKNCNFTIPSTVLSDATTRDIEYSNVDLFTGWHNVSISNCNLTILADTKAGACLQMRDIWSAGCDSGSFTNSTCTSNSHDEIISLFSSVTSTIKNIVITGNTIAANKGSLSAVRNVGISLGYSCSKFSGIDGVTFNKNTVNVESDYVLFTMGNSSNVNVSDNSISFTAASSNSSAYLVRGASVDNSIVFDNNKININNNTSGKFGGIVTGAVLFTNNDVQSEAAVTNALFANDAIAESNSITINNKTQRIGSCISDLKNNTLILKGTVNTMFEYYNKTLTKDVNISGNTINCRKASYTNDTLLMLNGTSLNGYDFTLSNNTVDIPNNSSEKTLYYIALKDTSTQKINLLNNDFSKYTKQTSINSSSTFLCTVK